MIFYIHGFNTGAAGTKAKAIADYFKPQLLHCYDQPHQPSQTVTFLREKIQYHCQKDNCSVEQVLLIGSSLGGFYARYLSSIAPYRCVLINPSIDPAVTLAPALGAWVNYVTGKKYRWQQSDLAALKQFYVENNALLGKYLLLVDEDDEVLDARQALEHYQDYAQIECYPGGNHQFQHLNEALPKIKRFYDDNCRD